MVLPPVEPISLTFGVVALASLFSTCVDCFGYFKAGQSLEDDFEILLVKLDLEKERLLIWGNDVGILKVENEGRAAELNESVKDRLIGRCLERIRALLSDTDKFRDTYGLRPLPNSEAKPVKSTGFISMNSMSVFKSSHRRFWTRPFASSQARPTAVMRTKWAIHDKVKFEGMISNLKDLIDGLIQVLPVKREIQDRIVREDISSVLDLSRLKLIRSACEGSYTTWSEIASEVIEATETGTVDRRNIEEWMRDTEGLDDNERDGEAPPGITSVDFAGAGEKKLFERVSELHWKGYVYFVLTGQCINRLSGLPCEQDNLGMECTLEKHSFLGKGSHSRWSIANLIVETLVPGDFTSVDLDQIADGSAYGGSSDLQEIALPVANIYIYCAPCACLVRTAMAISQGAGKRARTFFHIFIRPDDRLMSSCCSNADRAVGLQSIIDRIKDEEASSFNINLSLQRLDKPWIERRLDEIEEMDLLQSSKDIVDLAGGIFRTHGSGATTAGIIVLGELDYCLPIMQTPPFVSKPRIPKETSIFQMKWDSKTGYEPKLLGTYTGKPLPPGTAPRAALAPPSPRQPRPYTLAPLLTARSTTRQASPPPSPISKRPKISPSVSSADMEDAHGGPPMRDALMASPAEFSL